MSWERILKNERDFKASDIIYMPVDRLSKMEFNLIEHYFNNIMKVLYFHALGYAYDVDLAEALGVDLIRMKELLKDADSVNLVKYDRGKVSMKVKGFRFIEGYLKKFKLSHILKRNIETRYSKAGENQYMRGKVLLKHLKGKRNLWVMRVENVLEDDFKYSTKGIYLVAKITKNKIGYEVEYLDLLGILKFELTSTVISSLIKTMSNAAREVQVNLKSQLSCNIYHVHSREVETHFSIEGEVKRVNEKLKSSGDFLRDYRTYQISMRS